MGMVVEATAAVEAATEVVVTNTTDFAEPLVVDNFLPTMLAEPLYGYVKNLHLNYGWKSNTGIGYGHWNCDLADAGLSNGLDVSDRIKDKEFVYQAWQFIKSAYLTDYTLIRCYANGHTYGIEGYPHTDSKRDQDVTVVIYMNKNWKREWGGETLVYDGDTIVKGALPAFNRAMIFKGNQYHCARAVSRTCTDLRRTIMFKCAKNGADTKRDELQRFLEKSGADAKEHKLGSLGNHLLGTYDLLKAANQSEDICLAGGAHSLYGTSIYKDACLEQDDQAELLSIIGEKAMDLVKLFATTARPTALEATAGKYTETLPLTDGGEVQITREQFYALYVIEAANLYEQNSGVPSKYPNLKKFWSKIYKG
jgi:hypothetical protein